MVLVFAALNTQGRAVLAAAASHMALWTARNLVAAAPVIALEFAKALLTTFRENAAQWQGVTDAFTEEVLGTAAAAASGGSEHAAGQPGLAGLIHARPLVQGIIDAIAPPGGVSGESAQASLTNLLSLNIALAFEAWYAEVAGDVVSLGKFGAALDLPAALESGLGLNRLARLAYRTPIKKAIQEPLEELYNRRYQFKKLTLGEATQLWHKAQIDDVTFLDAAQAAGYSHDKAAQLLALGQRFYDVAQIRILNRLLAVPDTLALDLLREQGYTHGRDRAVLDILHAQDREVVLKELAAQARKLYQAGRLTQGQLTAILEEAHYRSDEVGIILATEDLVRAEQKQLTVAEIQTALRDGALDPGPARARLRQLGYQDQDVDILLSVRGKQPSSGQIIDAVVRGRLTPAEGQARLQREGYSPADAELLISLRGRRLTEGQVLDALRERLISAQQARADLQTLGFAPDAVDIILAFLRRTLSPADVQAAVLRGLLSEQEALTRLTEAGYTPADAQIIVTLRRRLLNAGEVLDAYGDGFIPRTEALGDLQARGFNLEDATALVRIFETKRAEAERRRQQRPPAGGRPPGGQAPPSGGRRGTGGSPPGP